MMKILIDYGNSPPKTGIGVYGRGVLENLQIRQKEDYWIGESGASSISTRFRPIHRLIYLKNIYLLRKKRFLDTHLVHFTNVYTPQSIKGVAYVTTIPDLDAIIFPDTYTYRYRLYFDYIIRSTIKRTHHLLTISEASRNTLINRYNLSPDRVSVIGIGLSQKFIQACALAQQPVFDGVPRVLFVGSLSRKKNIAWMIRTVVKGMRNKLLPQIKITLAGNAGFEFKEIEKEIVQAGDHVEWIQSPSLQIIAALYRSAQVVVLPSFTEGFGIPLIEAMYCGKPIVASRIPSSVEVAADAAYYFELGSEEEFIKSLQRALDDSDASKRRLSAQQQVEKYSWDTLSKKYIALYQHVVSTI